MRIFPFAVEGRLFYASHEADIPWLAKLIDHSTVSEKGCCGECNEKKKEYCGSCPKHSRKAV